MLEYLVLLIELMKLRDRMIDECDDEVSLLDRMEEAWFKCDEEERKMLDEVAKQLVSNKVNVKSLEQMREALEKTSREH